MLIQLTHQRLVPLVEDNTPILLTDRNAGLVFHSAKTVGKDRFYSQINPDLIAKVVAEKTRRSALRELNFKRWG